VAETGFGLMRRLAVQAAQTPEIEKVFCVFSSEKKALLACARQQPVQNLSKISR